MSILNNLCGLCHEPKELRRSHLMPAVLYELVKSFTESGDRRLVRHINARSWSTSDKQVRTPSLCADCEQLFSKNDESNVIRTCYRQAKFTLREKLSECPSIHLNCDGMVFFEPEELWELRSHYHFLL